MITFNFKKWNTIMGWGSFLIALIVYTLTVEPTMSFWDCGEYIATAAKLEVGHPPGAPLFQMMGAFFSIFATNEQQVALMVNMLSVFSSAFTILLMFWSMTMILKKMVSETESLDNAKGLAILGSAFVGSMTYTFTDSFWFNAVEAEVYAMASLLIALLFWLGLKWEEEMNTPRGNKWLLVISLVVGLSFGVHFMALLTIPSIGLLYYFKNFKKITIKNFIIANVVVVAVLLFIFKLLLPLTMALFGKTEIFAVNSLGLPFNSGTLIITLLIVAGFYFGLKYTSQKGYVHINTFILCILFIFIGFSTWLMLPVRANANTVINENKPSDAAEVLAYYNRDQYGNNPLFYGPQYSELFAGLDPVTPFLDKKPNYERDTVSGKYVVVNNYKNAEQNGDDNHKTILPRMWSPDHIANYIMFSNPPKFYINQNYDWASDLGAYGIDTEKLSEEEVNQYAAQLRNELEKSVNEFKVAYNQKKVDNDDLVKFLRQNKDYLIVEKPSTIDNLSYMIEYQFGYMYWRYLMWNFVGRQNDIQGRYDYMDGNWISGIKVLDELHLGAQDNLPEDILNNKGRNTYFFLPFILGLIGLMYHAGKNLKSFYVLLVLFLFTGIALKIYLNERPFEPRERDYALVGSFYIFAMWVGFGVYGLFESISKKITPKFAAIGTTVLATLAVPVLMATQNWDDHDRSDKKTALAMAKAYLSSCDKNAILFTIGDNDTFPLWYAQEIENFRTDVKIVNTSLLMTDWYIDQMKLKSYESEKLPISFKHSDYVGDKLDQTLMIEKTDARWNVEDVIKFIKNPESTITLENGSIVHFFPTKKMKLNVDKETIIKNKVVNPALYDSIVPSIEFDMKSRNLFKNRLIMLDLIANNNWKRPIYFSGGAYDDEDFLWMKPYLQLDGMVFKLVPIKSEVPKGGNPLDMGSIDSEKLYKNIMSWDWGNSDKNIYHDPETRRNSITYRSNMSRLSNQLILEGKLEKAKNIINLAIEKMPFEKFGYYQFITPFVDGYYKVGETQKADALADKLIAKYQDNLDYYSKLKPSDQVSIAYNIMRDIEYYRDVLTTLKDNNKTDKYNKERKTFNTYINIFERFGRDQE